MAWFRHAVPDWRIMMKQWLCSLLLLMLAVFGFSSIALAQNAEQYSNEKLTITPPDGWMLVSGSLGDKEMNQLPENIRAHYNARNTDVLFINIDSLDKPVAGFKNSLNIVTINEEIPLTPELVKELEGVLKDQ